MDFKIVVLWTDVLVFLLLGTAALFVWYVRRHEHLVAPWRRVAQSRSGMAAATVLTVFLMIGIVDSIHFRPAIGTASAQGGRSYSVEVLSLFDLAVTGLRTRPEKTYSAPFAYRLFAKETTELPGGRQVREYPRLKFGGAHLLDPERQLLDDISRRALGGVGLAFVLWLGLALLLVATLAHHHGDSFEDRARKLWHGEGPLPWNVILLTLFLILLLVVPAMALSTKYHVLGTNKVGQDVLYLALKSIRTGLVIGTLTTLVMLPFALLLGMMAGYFRGWVDDLIQYIYTVLNSIPAVLLIAAAVLMTQVYIDTHAEMFETASARADLRLLFLCLILGITNWTGLCRLLRGESLKLRELEYIQAAHAFGVSHWRVLTRHILPNVMHIVLIAVVMDFSGLVLAEAVLSYVGVGVDPSMISFGTMINSARLEMAREPMVWWSLAAAFAFMFCLVLAANLTADAVRDAFDPRVRVVKPLAAKARRLAPA
jgi:peptide/nickel transport system permease protein